MINNNAYNVGVPNGNYTIKKLAEIVNDIFSSSKIVFKNTHTDPRTYKVSFTKINSELNKYFNPIWTPEKGAVELKNYFNKINLSDIDFESRKFNRIKQLNYLIENKKINHKLYWI